MGWWGLSNSGEVVGVRTPRPAVDCSWSARFPGKGSGAQLGPGSASRSGAGGSKVEVGVHVEAESAVGVDVGPEQRGQGALLAVADAVVEPRCLQDGLKQQGVDVDQGGLQEVQGEHGGIGVLAVGAGQVAVFAVEDDGVAGVPLLHDLEAAVDLPSQVG